MPYMTSTSTWRCAIKVCVTDRDPVSNALSVSATNQALNPCHNSLQARSFVFYSAFLSDHRSLGDTTASQQWTKSFDVVAHWGPWWWWSLSDVHDAGGLVAHWGPWCWWSLTEVHDDGGRSLRSVMLVVAQWGPWWWWSGRSLRSVMLVVAHWRPWWCWWSLTEVHDAGGRPLRSVMLVVVHWGPWCWW